LLREFQRQAATLAKLNDKGSDLLRLDTDTQGLLIIDEVDGEGEVTDLLAEIELAIKGC
jgi:16S rRNA U516 pseudouridylate synthase RsuA-like enzyme